MNQNFKPEGIPYDSVSSEIALSESDDIAGAWRAVGAKLRRGLPPGEGTSIFDYIVDLEKGALSGAREGILNAVDLLIDSGNELNQYVLDHTGVDLTVVRDLPTIELPEVPDPQTPGGDAAKWLGQFFVGFGPIVKALRFARGGVPTTKVGTFAEMETAAAGASAVALDPFEKRLADFWSDHGLPRNILTDYLASNPEDTRAEGALKNSIESLGLGAIVGGGLFTGAKLLRALKGAERAKEEITDSIAVEARPIVNPPRVKIVDADEHDIRRSFFDFVSRAFTELKSKPAKLQWGRVTESTATRIFRDTGIDVHGYEHVVDGQDVRHILNKHGARNPHLRSDEIPVTEADIARVPEIIQNPDYVRKDVTRDGRDAVVYRKREGNTVIVVEEVRVGRKHLALKSVQKHKQGR